jgi:hypothetical protein
MSNTVISQASQQKFWAKVDKTDSCWNWTGTLNIGYGQFYCEGKKWLTHRLSYMLSTGELPPKNLVTDHLCRNRRCVNPEHLEPVTVKENILRGIGVAAKNAASTKCPRNHEYSGTNSRGDRICKLCAVIASRKHKEKVESL